MVTTTTQADSTTTATTDVTTTGQSSVSFRVTFADEKVNDIAVYENRTSAEHQNLLLSVSLNKYLKNIKWHSV